jgi:hypothetical protein
MRTIGDIVYHVEASMPECNRLIRHIQAVASIPPKYVLYLGKLNIFLQ